MEIAVREFRAEDIKGAIAVWNEIVEDGIAFPQTDLLGEKDGLEFFSQQSFTSVACDEDGRVIGLYILHPNNIGRCGHICNASYAVASPYRGKGIGQQLVAHCLEKSRELGFRIMQFNAVVASNASALHVYEKLGFIRLGTIPGGFLMKDGTYQDIILHYYPL